MTVLGSASCTLLGIAVSSLAKNGRSASAMVTPIALVLQFISGVFFLFSQVPTWMQTVAAFFPLKWMAQGLRSVFLPDVLARAGAGGLLGARPGGPRAGRSGASPGWRCASRPSAGRTAARAERSFALRARTADRRDRSPARRRCCCTTTWTAGCARRRCSSSPTRHGYRELPADGRRRASATGSGEAADSGSLVKYLETFAHTVGVMQHPDAIHRVARECALDLAADGVVYAEVRFAPELSTAQGLADRGGRRGDGRRLRRRAAPEATAAGTPIRVGALLCAMRQNDRWEEVAGLVVRYRDAGVVGFDLAGPEIGFPPDRIPSAIGLLDRRAARTAPSTRGRPPASRASAPPWTARTPSGSATACGSPTRSPTTARSARWRSGCATSR